MPAAQLSQDNEPICNAPLAELVFRHISGAVGRKRPDQNPEIISTVHTNRLYVDRIGSTHLSIHALCIAYIRERADLDKNLWLEFGDRV